MSAEAANFHYLRLPSDPFGASIGGLFWGAVALCCGWLALGAMFSSHFSWLDFIDPTLEPKLLLDSATLFNTAQPNKAPPVWLPSQALVDVGVWLMGRAFPLMMLLAAGVAWRRAWQFYRHRHDQSAHAWLLHKGAAWWLTTLCASGFAVWHHVPLGGSIHASLQGMSGGLLGNEVVSLLRLAFLDDPVFITLTLIAGLLVSGLWLFDLGLFSLCEKIGWLLEYFHERQFRIHSEAHDRSLGQVIAQLREQTVSLDKLAAAENTVRIVRQPVAAPQGVLPSQPQNLFGAVAELVPPPAPPINPPVVHRPPPPMVNPPPLPKAVDNPFSDHQTAALRHRDKARNPTAAYRIISRPSDNVVPPPAPIMARAAPLPQSAPPQPQPQPPVDKATPAINVPPALEQALTPTAPAAPPAVPAALSATDAFSHSYLLNSLLKKSGLDQAEAEVFEKTMVLPKPVTANSPLPESFTPPPPPAAIEASAFDLSLILPRTPRETPAMLAATAAPAVAELNAANMPQAEEADEADDEIVKSSTNNSPQYASWSHFPLPPISLLDTTPPVGEPPNDEVIRLVSGQIESALKSFGVTVEVKAAYPGPVITRYEIQLASGVKGAQIVNLAKDLARTLAVMSIRVVENIPGKPWMGLEVPNERRQMVKLAEIISSADFQKETSPLTMAIGKDISGVPKTLNLGAMPHLLVAGTTGSGKSVGLNDMILSMLFKATPNEVRMVMIDPKMVELSVYADIPHLIAPVITDMKQAVGALNWCVQEMERREQLLSKLSVRNIAKFNQRVMEARDKGKPLLDPIEKERLEEMGAEDFSSVPTLSPIPYLVVIVDEFADLFMVIGKKIEEVIARIAAKGRAGGIHLILATQRPSVDVVTGLIKANVPSRIAFQVSSKIDSRTILDQQGAEALLGQGDMLYNRPGVPVQRYHGAFVSDDEVNAVADYLRSIAPPKYLVRTFDDPSEEGSGKVGTGLTSGNNGQNEYDQAIQIIMESPSPSISYLQRRMEVGFNKAAKFIEQMEQDGIISPPQKNGKRTLMAPRHAE